MGPELTLTYNAAMQPIGGRCSSCGDSMPAVPTDPRDNVDAILWLSHHFLIHKQLKHPARDLTSTIEPEEVVIQ